MLSSDKVVDLILDHWHRPVTLIVLLLFAVLALLYLFSGIDLAKVSRLEWAAIFIVPLVVLAVWLWTNHVPRAAPAKIGFVIALVSESEAQRKVIEADLIQHLRDALDSVDHVASFDFIALPKHHARRIENVEDAKRYLRQCRANFLIFGSAKIRVINKKEFHVFRLREVVAHSPIPTEVSRIFSKEMSEVFPGNINVDRENDLIGLEITSKWITEASLYFIGVAALVSGDFDLAEALLSEIRRSRALRNIRDVKNISRLRGLIPKRLADLYQARARMEFLRWQSSRVSADMDRANHYIEKYNSLLPNQYTYFLFKGMWAFVCKHDVDEAYRWVNKGKGNVDGSWRYSLAFLEAYRGSLEKARFHYNKAFSRPVGDNVVFDVENFLEWVLLEEPKKCQLHFCLGLINLKAKQDVQSAKKDLRAFLGAADCKRFGKERSLAEQWLLEIERGE